MSTRVDRVRTASAGGTGPHQPGTDRIALNAAASTRDETSRGRASGRMVGAGAGGRCASGRDDRGGRDGVVGHVKQPPGVDGSGRERPDRGTEAHAHPMLSVKSAPRGRTPAPQQGVRRLRHRRGGGTGELDGPESPSTWKGRTRSAACPASINRTVVILVAPPFGRHATARCVVVTGARRGRHDRVTPGGPPTGGGARRAPARRSGSGPSPVLIARRRSLRSLTGKQRAVVAPRG